MRIGIDASRAFGTEKTGTENYSFEMIRHILALPQAKEQEWIIYTRNLSFDNYHLVINPQNEGFLKLIENMSNVKLVNIQAKFFWTQVGLAFCTWVDNLDVLWVPAHTLPVLRKPGLKTVVTIHGIEYEWLPAYENLLQRWYLPLSTKYAVRSANKIIAVSNFTKSQLVERLGGVESKIVVVYEGVSTTLLRSRPRLGGGNEGVVLAKFGLQPKKYLLFIGTVQPRKNLNRLIEAFSYITSRPPLKLRGGDKGVISEGVKLVIIGKLGWQYENIITAPRRFGVEDKIKFVGYVNDVERDILLQSALTYVQPSVTEGFGLPIIEAWKAGVPVVSSRGGALKEVVGEAGLIFDPFDIKDISYKLSLVIGDHKLRQELIRKGTKRAREFSWRISANKTYSVLIR